MSKKIKKKQTRKRGTYPPELKREIAQRYENGDFSYGAAADEYGLANKDVVKEFVKWYRRLVITENDNLDKRKAELSAQGLLEPLDNDLSDDPVELKRMLRQAQLEAEAFRTLVRVAEEQTGYAILKKPIAKPPVK